jgi:hypothetical protein
MNVSNEQRVLEEAAVRALRAARASDAATAPKRHSAQTPQCPSLGRFTAVLKFGGTWTADEGAHLRTKCPYCERTRRAFAAALTAASQDDTFTGLPRTGEGTQTATGSSEGAEDTVTDLKRQKPGKPGRPDSTPG